MINTIDAARGIAHQYLNYIKSNGTVVELQTISEVINDKILGMFPDLDIDELIGILLSDYSVGSGLLTSLTDDHITPWLKDKKSEINWQGWNRYKLYLQDKDPAFPINDLDDFTDKILDKCVNPQQEGSWDRRGMVVGHVQSGKTSN